MSDLTEREILDRHRQSLFEARDHCLWLATQQRDDFAAPRGARYTKLRKNLKELEGSARQMAHFRGDARWIRLGTVYAKAMPIAQRNYIAQKWKTFGELVQIFEKGIRSCDEIANKKTGVSGLILPNRPADWLVMPDWQPYGGVLGPPMRQ